MTRNLNGVVSMFVNFNRLPNDLTMKAAGTNFKKARRIY